MIKRIVKGSTIIFSAIMLTSLLEYGYQVSMANFLPPTSFGILSISLSLFWICAIVLTSGVRLSLAKFISEDTNNERVSSYLFSGIVIQLILAVALSAMVALLSFFVLPHTKYFDLSLPVVIISLLLIPYSIFEVLGATLQGLERMKELGLMMSLERGIKLAVAIALVILGYELFGAISAFFFSFLLATIVGFLMLRKYVHRTGPIKARVKKILSFSIPTAVITVFFAIILRSDVICLKILLPPDVANSEVGYYAGSAVLARLIFYFSSSLPVVLLPIVSSVYEKGERAFNVKEMKEFILVVIISFVLIDIGYLLWGSHLVKLFFPPEYLRSVYVLPYLAIGVSILSVDNIIATMIIGIGTPKTVIKALIGGLTTFLGLIVILVPKYGILGTAWGMIGGGIIILISILSTFWHNPKAHRSL